MGLGPAWKGAGLVGRAAMAMYLSLEGLNKKNSFLTGLEAGSLRSRCPGLA